MKNVIFIFLSAIFISLGASLMSKSCAERLKECEASNVPGACKMRVREHCKDSK